MGLTTSLYTGLTGLNANAQTITVTGNNIANANTIGYKASRADFETQISQTLRAGRAPGDQQGGTNPTQIGLGVRLSTISKNFTDGAIQPTGVNTDMAIDGDGFFVLKNLGETQFTRTGNFSLDRDSNLVSPSGGILQGYGVDENFEVVDGPMADINIPLDSLTVARKTSEVRFTGNLDAGGEIATQGSLSTSAPLFTDAGATTPATGANLLTGLFNAAGQAMFQLGDVITLSGVTKGTATLPDASFEVGPAATADADAFGQTLDDFMGFLDDVLGLEGALGAGVSINANGEIQVASNTGRQNGVTLDTSHIVVNRGVTPTTPLAFNTSQEAVGESLRTTFVAYDSLGEELLLDITFVLEDKTNAGTNWRFYAQSADDTDLDRGLGTGMVSFDTQGRLIDVQDNVVQLDRANTGAESPQSIELRFREPGQALSSLAAAASNVNSTSQDGFPMGTLVDFTVGDDGLITGLFTNSQLKTLGQIKLAKFINPGGLSEQSGSVYRATPASGDPILVTPGTDGGRVIGAALELSNVDLSNEFISLINASTGFSASSRVVTTSDDLLRELLSAFR